MESISEYLNQPLPAEAKLFPQVLLRKLSDKYREHIEYLDRSANSIEARQDRDWKKELEEFKSDLEQRKEVVKQMIALNLREDSSGTKSDSQAAADREKARKLYAEFVKQHPKG